MALGHLQIQILLNIFSIASVESVIVIGRPCGQRYGFSRVKSEIGHQLLHLGEA